MINRYATFVKDIEPQGFDLAVMDGYISKKTVQSVKEILESPERRNHMVDFNYEVASRHYSYSVLRNQLNEIMTNFFGNTAKHLSDKTQSPPRKVSMKAHPPQAIHKHVDTHASQKRSA